MSAPNICLPKGKKHCFFAVIHVEDYSQAKRNAEIAHGEGADGIFLINHDVSVENLILCAKRLRDEMPKLWIGINCLGVPATRLFVTVPSYVQGVWSDNAGISERANDPVALARAASLEKKKLLPRCMYFGGVAFKYQDEVHNLAAVSKMAMPYVDVITTSGEGTGIAAKIEKLIEMRQAIGEHPLALASGVTPENVREFMPHVNYFLVATGISDSHTELNPARTRLLSNLVSTPL